MTKKYIPQHKAALYFNELAPIQGEGERCALFGHFYHPPDPDVPLDIQAALGAIYGEADYPLTLDYGQPPPEPALSEADASWAAA